MLTSLRSISLLSLVFSFISFLIFSRAKACTGHDVIISNITVTSITSYPNYYSYAYTYEIKNIGTAAISLGEIVLQNYVSANQTYEAGDPAAGGSFIAHGSTALLEPGGTYTGTYEIAAGLNYPVSSYPYFITDVYLNSETECDLTNNEYAGRIETTTTGTKNAHTAQAAVQWNNESKSFSVSDWQGSNTASLQYTIVSISGTVAVSGNTRAGQAVPLQGLQSGMYIIFLSDGEMVYSKKISY